MPVRFWLHPFIKMELNQQLISKGFRIENGNLVKYTIFGRKRKNWKSSLRGKSQQFMKEECEECGSNKDLTIHHKTHLSKKGSASEKNCQTLCRNCHDIVHDINQRQKIGRERSTLKVKKELKEGLLILEQDEWGSYRIID